MLPAGVELALQALATLMWCGYRLGWVRQRSGRTVYPAESWLSILTLAGATGLAIGLRDVRIFSTVLGVFFGGFLIVDAITYAYKLLANDEAPRQRFLRKIIVGWLAMILIAAVLLSLPLATRSGVPDYRHNFWDHVLNNLHAAVSAGSLIGITVYSTSEEYTFLGQFLLFFLMQTSGMLFTALGLSIARPFLHNAIRLRTILQLAIFLQIIGIVAMWTSWRNVDAPSPLIKFWWGLVHSGSALWNGGLTLRSDGLAQYVWHPTIFACITTFSIAGSLGLPLIVDLVLGRQVSSPSNKLSPTARDKLWKSLPQWEAGMAFVLLFMGAAALWYLETPWRPSILWRLPDSWIPARPVDLGSNYLILRDDMPLPRRWTLAVFVSATLRSSGMQSFSLALGTLSWPSIGLLLLWMFIGGSMGGVGGGLRTTTLLAPLLCLLTRRQRWAATPDGLQKRRQLLSKSLMFIPLWLALCLGAIFAVIATTGAQRYEQILETIAAVNGVGLSTGLSLHLTPLARGVMIAIMIVGRWTPILYWLHAAQGLATVDRVSSSK